MKKVTLKNGFTVQKEGVYNGYETEYRWFLYAPDGELVHSYSGLEKAREAAYKIDDGNGIIKSQFPTEAAADSWIRVNRYNCIYSKEYNSISQKWIVSWKFNDDEPMSESDRHPSRPIEL